MTFGQPSADDLARQALGVPPENTDGTGPAADQQQEQKVHPAWDQALAAIPEELRGPIYEQIRSTETESQKAIEKAREESTPEEWRALVNQASEAGIEVDELIDSYNAQSAMRDLIQEDPDGFLEQIGAQIDEQVKAGALTRKQGQQARAEAVQAVADTDAADLDSPLKAELDDLKAWRDRQEQAAIEAQEQAEAEAFQQEVEDHGQELVDQVNSQMDATAALHDATAETRLIVATFADSILNRSGNENMPVKDAVAESLRTMAAQFNLDISRQYQAQAPGQQRQAPAVGGGNGQAVPSTSFKTEDDREAAMLEAGRRAMGLI